MSFSVRQAAHHLEVILLIWQDLNLYFLVNHINIEYIMIIISVFMIKTFYHCCLDASETGSETGFEAPGEEQESIDCDDDKDQSANFNADPAEPGRTGFWCIQIILIIPQPINYNLYFDNEARIYISSSLL